MPLRKRTNIFMNFKILFYFKRDLYLLKTIIKFNKIKYMVVQNEIF